MMSGTVSILDVRGLAGSREVAVVKEAGLFPVLTVAPGGAIVGVLRGGAGHLGTKGRIEVVRSRDGGSTWTPPQIVADTERDDRNPALGTTSKGTVILAYHSMGRYDEEGTYRPQDPELRGQTDVMVTRSHDGGLTWEEPFALQETSLRTASPFGKIVELGDGTSIMAIYGGEGPDGDGGAERTLASYLVRSRDDGATWGDPSLIARGMNETGLAALPDGDLLAVTRRNGEDFALWSTRSGDGGRTWSEPVQVTEHRQHPADLLVLGDGTVLLAYGNRTPPYRVEGRVSRDGGRTWLARTLAFSGPLYGAALPESRRTDLGYPSSVVVEVEGIRRGVTMYYYNPDIPQARTWQDEGPAGPFYRADGYRGVAVTWDEAELLRALAEQASVRTNVPTTRLSGLY